MYSLLYDNKWCVPSARFTSEIVGVFQCCAECRWLTNWNIKTSLITVVYHIYKTNHEYSKEGISRSLSIKIWRHHMASRVSQYNHPWHLPLGLPKYEIVWKAELRDWIVEEVNADHQEMVRAVSKLWWKALWMCYFQEIDMDNMLQ